VRALCKRFFSSTADPVSLPASTRHERISVCTYNVWNTEKWSQRAGALEAFFRTVPADIFCLQEVRPTVLSLVDRVLQHSHSRVADNHGQEAGWTTEGNIYWNRHVFRLVRAGTEHLKLAEPHRRLFWAQLQCIEPQSASPPQTQPRVYTVCQAHYTWEGAEEECESGLSKRVQFAQLTADFLQSVDTSIPNGSRIAKRNSAATATPFCIFAGDLNDRYHPRRVLRQRVGYVDTFTQLALSVRSTWPTPSFRFEEDLLGGTDGVCDFIFTQPRALRAIASQVVDFSHSNIYPSDHYPILALLQPLF